MNRFINRFLNTAMIVGLVASLSCSSDGDDPVAQINTGKQITSFKLNVSSPKLKTVSGVVDEANKRITVALGVDDDFSSVTAETGLSAAATISPAPGTARSYAEPVKFTVTAEDNTTAEYTVEVNRVKMTVSGVSKQTVVPGSTFTITGKHLFSYAYPLSVLLIDETGEHFMPLAGNTVYDDHIDVQVPAMMEIGSYDLKVRFDDFDSVTWATPIVIDFPNHNTVITEVATDKYLPSGEILYRYQLNVRGRFLGNTSLSQLGNSKVYLVLKSNESVKQELTKQSWSGSETGTYFDVGTYLPGGTLAAGEYYVEIVYNGTTHRHTQTVTYPW